jgi:hypothetical protein
MLLFSRSFSGPSLPPCVQGVPSFSVLPLSLEAAAASKGGNRRGFGMTKRGMFAMAVEQLTGDGMWPMGFEKRRQNEDAKL